MMSLGATRHRRASGAEVSEQHDLARQRRVGESTWRWLLGFLNTPIAPQKSAMTAYCSPGSSAGSQARRPA